MLNKVILIGNLGNDPETKETKSGKTIVNFSLATSERWTDKDGEKQTSTEWHKITAWGKLAEICEKYLNKGSKVYIEGKIKTNKWEDKDGNERYTTVIQAQNMTMLDSKARKGADDDIPF